MREAIYQAFHLDEALFAELLEQADEATQKLQRLYPLSDDETLAMKSYEEAFLVRFTYNSAAIEGSRLSLVDTALVIEGEFMPSDPGDKRLSDIFAARGIADGVAYASTKLGADTPISEELIKDVHERTALDCQPRVRGIYRSGAVYIRGSETVPVSAAQVRPLMGDLVFGFAQSQNHPILRAAAFHALFENIHPFADGNGRTGRILLNYLLEKEGYPPIALKAENRAAYLSSLEDWQVRQNPRSFVTLVCEQIVEEATARYEGIMQSRSMV